MSTSRKVAIAASGVALAGGWGLTPPCQAREWSRVGDAGVFLNFHFGGPRGGAIGFGIEGRALLLDTSSTCGGTQQQFAGAVARIEGMNWNQVRLMVGPTLGSTNGAFGYAGEAAVGVEVGPDRGFLAQVGAELEGMFLFNARTAYAMGRDAHVGLGVRAPPLSTSAFCVVGRPLRRGDGLCLTAGAVMVGRAAEGDIARAAAVWLQRARLEWASAPSFCELAEQLKASGAPDELAARARRAAEDELRHAAVSAALAARLTGAMQVCLDPPAPDHREVAGGRDGLVRLALESWTDGCLGEGAAADLALLEGRSAGEPAIEQAQVMIAGDEARHAALAWDVLEWTLSADRAGVRQVLPPAESIRGNDPESPCGATLKQFGIMDAPEAIASRRACERRSRERLSARLRA